MEAPQSKRHRQAISRSIRTPDRSPYAIDAYYAVGAYLMVIKETTVFTRRVLRLLDPESYRLLQLRLLAEPDAGDLIRGTGGLRKIRWEGAGRGKRGGLRVIYHWSRSRAVILMLLIYGKNEQDDLTADQRAALRRVVREELA